MEQIFNLKTGFLAVAAGIGSVCAQQLGGWDAMLRVLVVLMAVDYLTGLLVASVFKRSNKSENGALDSRAGFRGLCKKGVILLLVWVGVLLDGATGAAYIRTALVLFFAGNEGLSLLENVGLMGVPYPPFLRNALETLQKKGGEGSDTE